MGVRIWLIGQQFHHVSSILGNDYKNHDSHWFYVSLMLKLEINDILSLFCLSRINYISWYLYDIYRIISYLRATVSSAENVVKFIYQSDRIFPYNSKAIYPCIDYISAKNKTLWLKRYFSFHIVNFRFYIATFQQNLDTEIYLSFDTIFMSLWILLWLILW